MYRIYVKKETNKMLSKRYLGQRLNVYYFIFFLFDIAYYTMRIVTNHACFRPPIVIIMFKY